MELRFHIDPDTGLPHIYNHGITEAEVREALSRPGIDYPQRRNAKVRLGQTEAGRYLKIVYVPDSGWQSAFVVTAYPLRGKALKAFRRARRKQAGRRRRQ
jgi:hypothetical protein